MPKNEKNNESTTSSVASGDVGVVVPDLGNPPGNSVPSVSGSPSNSLPESGVFTPTDGVVSDDLDTIEKNLKQKREELNKLIEEEKELSRKKIQKANEIEKEAKKIARKKKNELKQKVKDAIPTLIEIFELRHQRMCSDDNRSPFLCIRCRLLEIKDGKPLDANDMEPFKFHLNASVFKEDKDEE